MIASMMGKQKRVPSHAYECWLKELSGSSIASGSLYSSRSDENNHLVDQGGQSPCQVKQAHSYFDSDDDVHHHPIQNDNIMYTTFAAPANKKSKKDTYSTMSKCNDMQEIAPTGELFCVPSVMNILEIDLGPDLNEFQPVNNTLRKVHQFCDTVDSPLKNEYF
jgi:hypothetical protein